MNCEHNWHFKEANQYCWEHGLSAYPETCPQCGYFWRVEKKEEAIISPAGAPKEVCICAAMKTRCGRVIRGHRHSYIIQAIIQNGMFPLQEKDSQGFITSLDRFVTREEGYALQVKAGIASVAPGGYRGERLYSEDLY